MKAVAQSFDKAAPYYDTAASLQAQVAERLVAWAQPDHTPHKTLDIGSGTGFVTQAILQRWPDVLSSALDASSSMLRAAQQKFPALKIISGDAAQTTPQKEFDAVFSSMALHWLTPPREILQLWQNWLKPDGRLYVALLTEDSFKEWRNACRAAGLTDGLWSMPKVNFADGLALRTKHETISIFYSSASEFLHRLKVTGAATPRQGHTPFNVPAMRRLMANAPRPFAISYDILYIELAARADS